MLGWGRGAWWGADLPWQIVSTPWGPGTDGDVAQEDPSHLQSASSDSDSMDVDPHDRRMTEEALEKWGPGGHETRQLPAIFPFSSALVLCHMVFLFVTLSALFVGSYVAAGFQVRGLALFCKNG